MKVLIYSPMDILHKLMVLSEDPEAKCYSLGEKATLLTQPVCPVRVLRRYPLDTLQTMIVLSIDPEAKYSPVAEKTTQLTKDEWP